MKCESKLFIHTKDYDWVKIGNGLSRKILGYNNQLMMVQVKFDKGAIGALHLHPHSQSTFVVSGKFKITIDDKVEILSEGEGFFVPPNVEHEALCLEDGILLDVFNPAREDFLSEKAD